MYDFGAGAFACIFQVHKDVGVLAGADFFPLQAQIFKSEGRVAQAEAERIKRGDIVKKIATAGRWLVIVKGRQMTRRARDGDGQLAAGIEITEQNISHRMTGFLAEIPAFKNRRDVFVEILNGKRTAVEKEHNNRFAG